MGIASALRAADESAPHGRTLACAHIRRGDFTEECLQYEREATRRDVRPWVRSHFRQGWGCLQSESELALNMRAAVEYLSPDRDLRSAGRTRMIRHSTFTARVAGGTRPSGRESG